MLSVSSVCEKISCYFNCCNLSPSKSSTKSTIVEKPLDIIGPHTDYDTIDRMNKDTIEYETNKWDRPGARRQISDPDVQPARTVHFATT
jgi:hypothetical protein